MNLLDEDAVRRAVRQAATRADVPPAVAAVYDDVAREVEIRRPICLVSGRCCRFEEFGHRLFVTTLELAAFLAANPNIPRPGLGCPFQLNKLCSVHASRPFGCRIFFCDATADEWQNLMYERFHARIKQLHGELGIPYFYLEWRAALDLLSAPVAP